MPNYPYNLTQVQGGNNLYDLVTNANLLTNGLIGLFTLIVLFLIVFMGLKKYESKYAFSAAGYITAIVAILFRMMAWVSDTVMFGAILLLGISFVWMRMSD